MRSTGRIDALRAALWTIRALRATKRQLTSVPVTQVRVPAPPEVGPSSLSVVRRTLNRWPSTCLEQAFVLQRWLAAGGDARDVVIGVTAPGEAFGAHAWVDGEADAYRDSVHELMRVAGRS
jgi:hypothetical protein